MNVTVESLAPCKKLVRVEVDAQKVDETFESVMKEFQRHAAFPGFRPGKAPRDMVLRKYSKDIAEQVKAKLIPDSYKKAIDEQQIDVLTQPDIEEIQFGRGLPLLFAATVETAPEFELPEYKGIPVRLEARSVTDEDIERALEALRQPKSSYQTAQRPAHTGDVVVVHYTGTCEGKPLLEIAPAAKSLNEAKNFWIEIGGSTFIPGFADQLVGAQAGDKRTVNVDFPADFMTPELAGKRGVYAVEVTEVKEKVLPALDETFAQAYGAESLDKLRAGVRHDLENELRYKKEQVIRSQITASLLNRINFELPQTAVNQATKHVVYDIVQQNAKRGITREQIEQHKDQIAAAATQNAKERVKEAFLLRKIAEKEDIKVSQDEIAQRITYLAAMYKIPADKFAKDLQARNGLIEIYDQIMNEKVIELLQQNAKIEDLPPGAALPNPS